MPAGTSRNQKKPTGKRAYRCRTCGKTGHRADRCPNDMTPEEAALDPDEVDEGPAQEDQALFEAVVAPALEDHSTSSDASGETEMDESDNTSEVLEQEGEVKDPDLDFDFHAKLWGPRDVRRCPLCDEPLPKNPSKKLEERIQYHLSRPHAVKRPLPGNPEAVILPVRHFLFHCVQLVIPSATDSRLIPFGFRNSFPKPLQRVSCTILS